MKNNRRICTITVDIDSIGSLFPRLSGKDESFHSGLLRFGELFRSEGVRATLFVVSGDLADKRNAAVLSELSAFGHEVANHTMTHPTGFFTLPRKVKEREIIDAEESIFNATGIRTRGFRAPGWNADRPTLEILSERDYLYDSSLFPTLLTPMIKLKYFWSARDVPLKQRRTLGRLRNMFASGNIRQIRPVTTGRTIFEVPLTLTPFLRLPFYGTMVFKFGIGYFNRFYRMVRTKSVVNFSLHLAELVEPGTDCSIPILESSFNRAFIPHCFRLPLIERYETLKHILRTFRRDYEFVPMIEAIEHISRVHGV